MALSIAPFVAGIKQRWANERETNRSAVGMATQGEVYPKSRSFLDDFGGVNEEEFEVILRYLAKRTW